MDTKRIVATIVGAVTAFLIGYLIWGILLMDYFKANTVPYEGLMIEPPRLWAIFIANLAYAFLFTWLFSRMNIQTFASGFQAGATIAFLLSLNMAMMYYALMNWYNGIPVMVVEIVVNSLFGGVIGGVIALVLGKVKKPAMA